MESEWIAFLIFEPAVSAKIRSKHNLSEEEVRHAVCFGRHREARWHVHPDYGARLVVKGDTADGSPVIVYLRPVDRTDGTWECRTAIRLTTRG